MNPACFAGDGPQDEQEPIRMRDRLTPEVREWAAQNPLSDAAAADLKQTWRRWRRKQVRAERGGERRDSV